MNLEDIKIDPKARNSINYVRARCAIEEEFHNRADKRAAKMVVVEFLRGTVVHPKPVGNRPPPPNYVLFPDQSQARF